MTPESPSEEWATLSEILSCLPKGGGLHAWKKKNPRWYEDGERAKEVASQVRQYAMILATGKSTGHLPTDPNVVQYLVSFFSWATHHEPYIIVADLPVFSGAYHFRSNLDILYVRDEKVWLTTITTASDVRIYHEARIAALRMAIAEMIIREEPSGWMLRFPEKLSVLKLKTGTTSGNWEEVITNGNFDAFERAYKAFS